MLATTVAVTVSIVFGMDRSDFRTSLETPPVEDFYIAANKKLLANSFAVMPEVRAGVRGHALSTVDFPKNNGEWYTIQAGKYSLGPAGDAVRVSGGIMLERLDGSLVGVQGSWSQQTLDADNGRKRHLYNAEVSIIKEGSCGFYRKASVRKLDLDERFLATREEGTRGPADTVKVALSHNAVDVFAEIGYAPSTANQEGLILRPLLKAYFGPRFYQSVDGDKIGGGMAEVRDVSGDYRVQIKVNHIGTACGGLAGFTIGYGWDTQLGVRIIPTVSIRAHVLEALGDLGEAQVVDSKGKTSTYGTERIPASYGWTTSWSLSAFF